MYPDKWQINTSATDTDSCDAFSISLPDTESYCGSEHFPPIYIKPLTAGDKLRCQNQEETIVNSYKAIKCTGVITSDLKIFFFNLRKDSKVTDYFFEGKGIDKKGVAMWFTQETGVESQEKIFNQILSTLKFH